MDPRTATILKDLEQHYDELDESPDSWESVFRIFLMAYGQLMEHSMYMAPPGQGEAVVKSYGEITASLNEIMNILKGETS